MESPNITHFSPVSGKAGDLVNIYGTNLENVSKCSFGAIPATIITQTSTNISVRVPKGASTSKINISLSAISPVMFTNTSSPSGKTPIITDFSPSSGKAGDIVTISGMNLEHINQVKIGGILVEILNKSASSISIRIPQGIVSGYVEVFGIATSPSNFTVGGVDPPTQLPPKITDFSPKKATIGSYITVTGENLERITSIKVGGISSSIFTEETASRVRFTMPAAGNITITTPGGIASSSEILALDDPIQPPTGNWNHYYGNLHAHTSFSDGVETPDARFAFMKSLANATDKADFGGITDHFSSLTKEEWASNIAAADKHNQDSDFVAMAGIEMSASPGEQCTYNFNAFNLAKPPSCPEYYAWLTKNYPGSFCQLNHTKDDDWGEFPGYKPEYDSSCCLLEVYNAGHGVSLVQYQKALNAGWKVGASGNGDYHSKQIFTSTGIRTIVLAKKLTRADIFEAIHARRTYATMVKDVKMTYTINNLDMGTIAKASDFSSLQVAFTIECPSTTITKLELWSNNNAVLQTVSPNAKTYSWNVNLPSKAGFYYVLATLGSSSTTAVTSPIFLN